MMKHIDNSRGAQTTRDICTSNHIDNIDKQVTWRLNFTFATVTRRTCASGFNTGRCSTTLKFGSPI